MYPRKIVGLKIVFTGGHMILVIRTYDGPKNPYTSLFLHTILGPEYYVPP